MRTIAERKKMRADMNIFAAGYMKLNPAAKRKELDKALTAKFAAGSPWLALIMQIIQAILDHWFPKNP